MRVFPDYLPQRGLNPKYKYEINVVKFGDGYDQRGPKGLNNEMDSYPLTFRLPDADIDIILEFLRSHKGYIAFQWTPPDRETGVFTCKAFSGPKEIAPGHSELKCTFDRKYDL